MTRSALFISAGLLVVVAGGVVVWQSTRPRPPVAGAARVPSPPPAAAPTAPPPPAASVPEPAPGRAASTPRPARRAPAPAEPATPPGEPAVAATMATLHISSDVPGAQVFIDRNYVGVTPVTSPELPPGPHRVNVVAQGYESIAENVDVEAGPRDLQFKFKEVRLDASVEVVHKHRIGSCKGRLVATPQGLRYDTDDKSDRFTLALTDLEIFEVDYLAKTLKVKGTSGKRFEFSDPTAVNGDRLFVFHRDVDKARQRLKQGS